MKNAGNRRSESVLRLLVAVVVVGSVTAVGTVHLPTLLVVSSVAIGAACLAIRSRLIRFRVSWFLPALVTLGLSAYSLMQALPIPADWLARIAPSNASVWQRALAPFGEAGPGWMSVSLDPGASGVEALKWLTYCATFVAAMTLASRRGATWGISAVFFSGIAAAVTTVLHGLVGATRVFGVYQPRFQAAPWHVGPLLNPNNLAGYLNLSAMCGFGLMLTRGRAPAPWASALGIALILAVSVTSASRGGVVMLAFGVALFAVVLLLSRRRPMRARLGGFALLVGGAMAGGACLALLSGTAEIWRDLADQNLRKLEIVSSARPMVADHRWLGVGRGAFASVFPAYRTEPGNVTYEYAENFLAQWASEWGVPVALGALGYFVFAFRPQRLGVRRSALAAGAWAGVVVLVIHNLVDLAFEVPAVMIALTTTLGSLWGESLRREPSVRTETRPRRASYAAGALAVVGFGVVAFAGKIGWHDAAADRASLYRQFNNGAGAATPAARSQLRRELRAAMLRHPAEPYFPYLGALVAWVGKDANPVAWLSRALERGPDDARVHLVLARVLHARGGTAQALMEIRLAAQRDVKLVRPGAELATRLTRDYQTLLDCVPAGESGAAMLEALAGTLSDPAQRATRRRLLVESLARAPSRPGPRTSLAFDLLAELSQADSEICGKGLRSACVDEVETHATALETNDPRESAGARVRAQLLRLEGNAALAEKILAERCGKVVDRIACLDARLRAATEATEPQRKQAAIKDYLAVRCGSADDCADASELVGSVLSANGDWGEALSYFARAAREAPTEQRWLRLADAASHIGAHVRAVEALSKVQAMRGGTDSAIAARIEAERAAAMAEAPP